MNSFFVLGICLFLSDLLILKTEDDIGNQHNFCFQFKYELNAPFKKDPFRFRLKLFILFQKGRVFR